MAIGPTLGCGYACAKNNLINPPQKKKKTKTRVVCESATPYRALTYSCVSIYAAVGALLGGADHQCSLEE